MIQKVIAQLSKAQFEKLDEELSENRGEKFSKLLQLYREKEYEDAEIREIIGVKQAAFYTLKSRLFDKVQQYLFRTSSDNRAELLKNVSSVPYLVYHTPRETAISLLLHLEAELKKEDMSAEKVIVYNGLKTLHLHTPLYYQYQQLYNKNVAYMLALDKADELVSVFNRELGEFLLSGDTSKISLFKLYLTEFKKLCALYDSHRLKINRIIANVSYAVFVDEKHEVPDPDETVEELLAEFKSILKEHPEHRNYRFLEPIWQFLNFEYYHLFGRTKNSQPHYEKLNDSLETFLLLSHSCPATHFLIVKHEHEKNMRVKNSPPENHSLLFHPDPEDVFSCVNLALNKAACFFHNGNFSEAASCLNQLLNEISFKNFPFAEAHVKLFLTLNALLAGKSDQAELTLRSISRKLAGEDLSGRFPAAEAFSRFLKIALNDSSSSKSKKLETALTEFTQVNNGHFAVIKYAPLNDVHLGKLSN
ncbi:hypothetical protein BH09BAC5_BH09BAC5_01950 [soil metagenome]